MKAYHMFECEICGKQSQNPVEIRKCECVHYNLTLAEMQEWQHLQDDVKRKGATNSLIKNEKTEKVFDDATTSLLKFEKEHGLTKRL